MLAEAAALANARRKKFGHSPLTALSPGLRSRREKAHGQEENSETTGGYSKHRSFAADFGGIFS